jgi:hypothetical protein
MRDVGGDRERSARCHRGGVARHGDEGQRQRGENERLAAGGDPVRPFHGVRGEHEKGAQHEEHGVAREPHEPRPRVEHDMDDGAHFERGVRAILEHRRPCHQPCDAAADAQHDDDAAGADEARVPASGRRRRGHARQQHDAERPDEHDTREQVCPERGEQRRAHCSEVRELASNRGWPDLGTCGFIRCGT